MSQPTDSCPTRQQLDELEALMQRMLALPVSEGEDALPPLPDAKPRPAMLPPRLRAIPDPPTWEEPTTRAAPSTDVTPPPARPVPVVRTISSRPAAPPPVVISERVSVEDYVAPAEAAPIQPPAPEAPPLQVESAPRRPGRIKAAEQTEDKWWLTPLVWTNHAFDRGTLHLGRSGRWLRGTQGRTWIGWGGLALLAAAAAWALSEWLGWTW